MDRAQALADLFAFSGSTVAITGGGGDLPGAVAQGLAPLGLRLALLDLSLEKAEEKAQAVRSVGGEAAAFHCDVLDPESVRAALDQIRSLYGDVHYLINGAGGNVKAGSADLSFVDEIDASGSASEGSRTFFDLEAKDLRFTVDLNLVGTMIPSQVFGREMAAAGQGSIVNFASMSGITPLTKVGAYSAAKAAVANFTQWLSVHLSRVGVRVNALAPGFFMTEQLKFLHIDQTTGDYTPRAKEVLAHTPMKGYGDPEDLVGAVVWLLSDAARFVTGSVLVIDGGFSSYSI